MRTQDDATALKDYSRLKHRGAWCEKLRETYPRARWVGPSLNTEVTEIGVGSVVSYIAPLTLSSLNLPLNLPPEVGEKLKKIVMYL